MHLFKKTRINNPRQKTSFHFLPFLRQKRQKSAKNRTKINKTISENIRYNPHKYIYNNQSQHIKTPPIYQFIYQFRQQLPIFRYAFSCFRWYLSCFLCFLSLFHTNFTVFQLFWPSYRYFWLEAPYYHHYPTLLDITACSVHQKQSYSPLNKQSMFNLEP